MITEQQIIDILNLRESNIDGGETLGIHCVEYGNVARAILKLLDAQPPMQNKNQEPEQYFVAVPVSELPEDYKGIKKCFVIDVNGEVDYHYCDYIRRHPEKYQSFLQPISLAQRDKEVAEKAWEAAMDFKNHLEFGTKSHKQIPPDKETFLQSLK